MDHTQQPSATERKAADLVTLNVGGSLYTTTVATLTRYPNTMLGSMFSDRIPTHRDSNGHYIIDGDGLIFRHVLNFLRRSSLCLPHDFKEWDLLIAEADFFQIKELIDAVKSLRQKRSVEGSRQKMEFIEISFNDHNEKEVTYRGALATLKAIPTLWLHFNPPVVYNPPMRRGESVEGRVDSNGWIAAGWHFSSIGKNKEVNRMKIYQEMTQLGFRLLNTSILLPNPGAPKIWITLFARNTNK